MIDRRIFELKSPDGVSSKDIERFVTHLRTIVSEKKLSVEIEGVDHPIGLRVRASNADFKTLFERLS
jgi:hypothetical protein